MLNWTLWKRKTKYVFTCLHWILSLGYAMISYHTKTANVPHLSVPPTLCINTTAPWTVSEYQMNCGNDPNSYSQFLFLTVKCIVRRGKNRAFYNIPSVIAHSYDPTSPLTTQLFISNLPLVKGKKGGLRSCSRFALKSLKCKVLRIPHSWPHWKLRVSLTCLKSHQNANSTTPESSNCMVFLRECHPSPTLKELCYEAVWVTPLASSEWSWSSKTLLSLMRKNILPLKLKLKDEQAVAQ